MHLPGRRGQLSDAFEEETQRGDRKETQRQNQHVAVGAEAAGAQRVREAGLREAGEGGNSADDRGPSEDDPRER